ncbi:uncharacterized protein EI90DRAFT_3065294 [Cantharellus anzutake]|uniref:uncharacterized protein n=1 Tax=Cantharellus anzutake TaxID=1750568 RepID=UPI001906B47A|nr:uncharacterized protein EI90DRAFT_3065294 [Cantharellus anzutake]KAF8328436.1 hypothetical protein EI90DRAFT_3065294 [Cantharellus anzutake]
MAGVDFDKASVLTKRSIESVASKLSTFWSKIPLSHRKLSSSLADICSYIETTPDAESSPVNELIIYKEEKGVQHEFLLLRMAKPTGEKFWVRLERKRPVGALGNLISSALEANDIASLSGKCATLLGSTESVERTRIVFRVPPSLTDLFHVLEALRESSKFYKLWPENCWFFASVVAEHLYGLDKSAELTGTLRWLNLGADVRQRIHQMIASYDHPPVQNHDSESGSILLPGSPAYESAIDGLETENMSSASSTSLPRPLRRSESQMLLFQGAYSTVDLHAQEHPLKRVPLVLDSLSGSDDHNGRCNSPCVLPEGDMECTLDVFCEGTLYKVPLSSGETSHPLAAIYSYIESTPEARCFPIERTPDPQCFLIEELIVHKEQDDFQHEFLLLRLARPTEEEFWVRLERKGPTDTLGKQIFTEWDANDMATLSWKCATLLDNMKSVEKTRIIFRIPPSLMNLFRVLEALRESSEFYKVCPENCCFFVSVVAEYLYGLDESAELIGTLRWLGPGAEARRRIYQIIASYDPLPIQDLETESQNMSSPESPIGAQDMSRASGANMSTFLRRSESQMPLSQDFKGPNMDFHGLDQPLKRTMLSSESSLYSSGPSDRFEPPHTRPPTSDSKANLHAQNAHHPRKRTFSLTESSTILSDQIDQVDQIVHSRHLREEDILGCIPVRGDAEYTPSAFVMELRRSQEAEGTTVSRLLRYGTIGRLPRIPIGKFFSKLVTTEHYELKHIREDDNDVCSLPPTRPVSLLSFHFVWCEP